MTIEELQVIITANTQTVRTEVDKAKAKLAEFGAQAESSAGGIKKTFAKIGKVVAGVAVAIGVAVLAVAGKSVAFTEDLQKALNGLQTSTGATDDEMVGFKKTMISLYNQNYGENFEEIAQAMADVKTQTGLSGKALEDMTKKAFILKDTFGFEITSSVKSADQMMKQFAITSDEAMELMAQGAQNGLDSSGEMLDSINEYSVQFAQAGFSAEEMFNMMSNSAKNGGYSVDKVGDAVKEFGLRSKDMSKSTSDAFKSLGLDSDKMTSAFGKGGVEGKKAFEEVNKKLLAMKDPVAQNTAGVALYGSTWEDLGIKGISAMTNTQGAIDKTKNKMKEIEKIKYNTFGEAFKGIGRTIMTSVFIPIGEKLIPVLQKMSQYIIDNMPKIKENIKTALDFISPLVDVVVASFTKLTDALKVVSDWVIQHQTAIENIALVVGSFALAWGLVTGAIAIWNVVGAIATGITTGFGVAIAFITSPIGIVVLAIGALIAIGVLLYKNWDKVKEITMAVWNSIKAFFGTVFASIKAIFTLYVNAWKLIIITVFNAIKFVITNVVNGIKIVITTVWNAIKSVTSSVFNGVKSTVSSIWNGIKSTITTVVNGIKSTVTSVWNGIKSTTTTVFNGVKTAVLTPINAMRDGVKAGVDKIKGFFSGMKLTFPKIKMPHFNIDGKFSLAPPSVPKLGVNWYAQGGVFDKASLIGVGENGSEAVVPLEKNLGWVDKMAQKITAKMDTKNNGESGGLNVTITNFINNRQQDVQAFAEELEYYRKQQARGGNY